MPKRPTLDPLLDHVAYCVRCRKVMGQHGYHGAECQCDVKTSGSAAIGAHSAGQTIKKVG